MRKTSRREINYRVANCSGRNPNELLLNMPKTPRELINVKKIVSSNPKRVINHSQLHIMIFFLFLITKKERVIITL